MNKPEHLSQEIADQFGDKSIVQNYSFRPAYSQSVIDTLSEGLAGAAKTILDIGSGTGEVSIPLALKGYCVTGVDPSAEMVKAARAKAPAEASVDFVHSYIEQFKTEQKFDLFVAANSIHWPDWSVMFPLLNQLSNPGAKLAIVTGGDLIIEGIENQIIDIVKRYSTTKNFKPYSVIEMLSEQGYIENLNIVNLPAETLTQSTHDYILSFHARNGFSLDRMNVNQAAAFDSELEALLGDNGYGEQVTGQVKFVVTFAEIVS